MTTLVARDDLAWSASGCALANAGVHLYLVPAHLTEAPDVGVLFVVGAAGLLAAAGLLQPRPRTRAVAWWLGAAVSAGMLAGYPASRTVGLPLGDHEGWADPYGVACLLLEAAYLAAFAARATGSP